MTRAAGPLPAPRLDWAYFFDIDGTLVDFTDAPRAARLDGDLRGIIERLHGATGGAVALISGRAIADIDVLLSGTRFPAAGQHGTERRDASGTVTHHARPSPELDRARLTLSRAAAAHHGLLLEDKGLSLAVHYRRAPRLGGYAHRLVRSLLAGTGGTGGGTRYAVQTGKRVVELKPAGRDKGVAVLEFMREEPFRGRTPVFVGDDVTDEFGFAAVNRLHGHSVKVGSGRTVARWRLRDVRAVREWLERGFETP
ncbi:MAG: trehalose-phosphatase [Gemmatimonadetes bacterium]|nr:MAG: trehalose-phosphatase [Gemmatimonadota bacterium]PYO74364.1 MAG: trehalose-phosphatase [Gemmatimonadota bacterium]TLY50013.1 MAG: trehalose-phosphatase [Gemmatimonadota bacterium]